MLKCVCVFFWDSGRIWSLDDISASICRRISNSVFQNWHNWQRHCLRWVGSHQSPYLSLIFQENRSPLCDIDKLVPGRWRTETLAQNLEDRCGSTRLLRGFHALNASAQTRMRQPEAHGANRKLRGQQVTWADIVAFFHWSTIRSWITWRKIIWALFWDPRSWSRTPTPTHGRNNYWMASALMSKFSVINDSLLPTFDWLKASAHHSPVWHIFDSGHASAQNLRSVLAAAWPALWRRFHDVSHRHLWRFTYCRTKSWRKNPEPGWGVVFLSSRFCRSDWCGNEMQWIWLVTLYGTPHWDTLGSQQAQHMRISPK